MAKGRKKKPTVREKIEEPTPEQFASGTFERAGLAYRRVAVIDTMLATGKLSDRQYNGLRRYRDVALVENCSPLRDSLAKAMDGPRGSDGSGVGLPPSVLRASIETGRMERALGQLVNIARAIAVDDTTVSQWAMRQAGSVMRVREGKARAVVTWFEPQRKALKIAMLEIKMAGERLAAEIGA